MGDIILTAMIAAFLLLTASVVGYRIATAAPEDSHEPEGCRHCAALFGQTTHIPEQRTGGES